MFWSRNSKSPEEVESARRDDLRSLVSEGLAMGVAALTAVVLNPLGKEVPQIGRRLKKGIVDRSGSLRSSLLEEGSLVDSPSDVREGVLDALFDYESLARRRDNQMAMVHFHMVFREASKVEALESASRHEALTEAEVDGALDQFRYPGGMTWAEGVTGS